MDEEQRAALVAILEQDQADIAAGRYRALDAFLAELDAEDTNRIA